MIEPIRLAFEVDCPPDHAFETWTGRIGQWWPADHTVSAEDGTTFDSGALAKGGTFQFTAGAPGTYTYFCRIHPFMKATLTVTP